MLCRSCKLGHYTVSERGPYNHVGINSAIFEDELSEISERLSKACRTLNAGIGLGILKNGLTMHVRNIPF